MKILITGASGSGTTTLAGKLAATTGFEHLDADDFYWEKTDRPYQRKIPADQRREALKRAFEGNVNVVVSGSLVSWGTFWESAFDLVVYLYLPSDLRMERLRQREVDRYGSRLITDSELAQSSKAFLDWAAQYDDPAFEGRSKVIHLNWLKKVTAPILTLDGDKPLGEKLAAVRGKML